MDHFVQKQINNNNVDNVVDIDIGVFSILVLKLGEFI